MNGGICTNNGPDNYSCQCSESYTGHDCDVDVDYCAASPCQNGATCDVRKELFSYLYHVKLYLCMC